MEKQSKFDKVFTKELLTEFFPKNKSDLFFEMLYGDADEGAYDIELSYGGYQPGELKFNFGLKRRVGKCLACNLTYGLPQVFLRHPVMNMEGLMEKFKKAMDGSADISRWEMGRTEEISRDLHIISLKVFIKEK
ncbi:MAG: pancreas/duodenum homeobox protein 1 [Desulfobacterales bacterium]